MPKFGRIGRTEKLDLHRYSPLIFAPTRRSTEPIKLGDFDFLGAFLIDVRTATLEDICCWPCRSIYASGMYRTFCKYMQCSVQKCSYQRSSFLAALQTEIAEIARYETSSIDSLRALTRYCTDYFY